MQSRGLMLPDVAMWGFAGATPDQDSPVLLSLMVHEE